MSKVGVILIVDDDIDDRTLFIEAMKNVDASVQCYGAQDGEDALDKLNNSLLLLPDIIFLDLNMPRIDGREFLKEIKGIHNLNHIPVVIYSTSNSKRDIDETTQLGAKFFFTKPFGFSEICKGLSQVLETVV